MQRALTTGYGALPYIGCTGPRFNQTAAGANSTDAGRTVLAETWYYLHVFGRPQDGVSLPVNASGSAPGALHYPLRAKGSAT
ncbi:hypothetical protein LTR66_010529 [Elasticomyces elasticus]|nr:hypothetical protein LTR66_010529 [Elasticomyces elasticus]